MKKILFMSALSIAVFGAANAQTAQTATPARTTTTQQAPSVKAKFLVSKITNAVALEGAQFGKVNTILVEYYTKLETLGANATAAQKTDLDKATDKALQGVLTAEQFAKYQSSNIAK